MATNLSDGYIYFIESDAADNQNWVTTPGNIDLDNFTEGTDYCKLEIPKQWAKECYTGIQVEVASGGKGFQTRTSRRYYKVMIQSNEEIGSDIHNIDKFFTSDRHTASSSSTFTDYYLVICRDESSNDFEEFTDSSNNRRDYCKGVVTKCMIIWNESENLRGKVQIEFMSSW